jgi:uncharacterized lipoprotein YajG
VRYIVVMLMLFAGCAGQKQSMRVEVEQSRARTPSVKMSWTLTP